MNKLSIVREGATAASAPQPISRMCKTPRVTWAVNESEAASRKPFDGEHAARQDR